MQPGMIQSLALVPLPVEVQEQWERQPQEAVMSDAVGSTGSIGGNPQLCQWDVGWQIHRDTCKGYWLNV